MEDVVFCRIQVFNADNDQSVPAAITATSSHPMACAPNAASSVGHANLNCRSSLPRSTIQCQAVCATSADNTSVPTLLRSGMSEDEIERRNEQRENQHLSKLNTDVERQQRREQVRARELQ